MAKLKLPQDQWTAHRSSPTGSRDSSSAPCLRNGHLFVFLSLDLFKFKLYPEMLKFKIGKAFKRTIVIGGTSNDLVTPCVCWPTWPWAVDCVEEFSPSKDASYLISCSLCISSRVQSVHGSWFYSYHILRKSSSLDDQPDMTPIKLSDGSILVLAKNLRLRFTWVNWNGHKQSANSFDFCEIGTAIHQTVKRWLATKGDGGSLCPSTPTKTWRCDVIKSEAFDIKISTCSKWCEQRVRLGVSSLSPLSSDTSRRGR